MISPARAALAWGALTAAVLLGPGRTASQTLTSGSLEVYARANPIGLALGAGASQRWLRPDGESPLWRGRYFQLGALLLARPDGTTGGIQAEWVPAAPLQIGAGYQLTRFAGRDGSLLRFDSPRVRFGSDDLRARRGQEQTGVGQRAFVAPVLRARLGRLVLRNETELSWYRMSPRPGWYYESEHDTLLAEHDVLGEDRAAVLVDLDEGRLFAGPLYELTRAARSGIARQRAGGLIAWSVPETWPGLRPRLLALAGIDLEDRNRAGQAFAAVALGGDFDLWRTP